MTDLCAIQGQLVDVRNVFTDKCVKLTIHVSAERAMEVMTAFGWPTNVSPVSVAIARLNADGKEKQPSSHAPESKPAPPPDHTARAPRKWEDITPAQQAGIRCNEPAFVKFLNQRHGQKIETTQQASEFVRDYCGVESRSDIRDGEALDLWQMLEAEFRSWLYAPLVGAS